MASDCTVCYGTDDCGCLSFSVFPIFFVTCGLVGAGTTYDLGEGGPIFWSKLTLYIITLT